MMRGSTVYAGHLERLFAYLLDSVLLIVVTKLLSMLFGSDGMALILSFAVSAAYYTYFTASAWQATPGKRLLGLYVMRTDHRAVGLREALERFLAFILPSLPLYASFIPAEIAPSLVLCLSLSWFAPILFTDQHTGMHDRFCHTRVLVGKVGL